jgi:hypothetical protein
VVLTHIDVATGFSHTRPAGDFGGPVAALRILLDAVTGPVDPGDAPLALVASTVAGVAGPGLRLQRHVNQRVGIPLHRDTLPERFFSEPVAAGRYAGAVIERTAFVAAVAELHQQLGFEEIV